MGIDMGAQGQRPDVSNRRKIHATGLWALLLLAGLAAAWPHVLAAQSPAPTDDMVRVGDRWTYATKDEITGLPTETFTHVVTEISTNRTVIGASNQENSGSRPVIFDRDWNRLDDRDLKFKPHHSFVNPPPRPATPH